VFTGSQLAPSGSKSRRWPMHPEFVTLAHLNNIKLTPGPTIPSLPTLWLSRLLSVHPIIIRKTLVSYTSLS
jgi:hypothetical protein